MFVSCKTRRMLPTSIDALDDEMVTRDGETYDLCGLQDCVVDNGMNVFSEHEPSSPKCIRSPHLVLRYDLAPVSM
jgi:hypothetical protein